jgi:hypothetical protein
MVQEAEMKRIVTLVLAAILLFAMTACAPGSSVQVTTPEASFQLSAAGANPLINQPDAQGRVARAGAGLWHGIIAPVTLVFSFFDPNTRMYEVHNIGSEYDVGFLLGLATIVALLGLFIRMRR